MICGYLFLQKFKPGSVIFCFKKLPKAVISLLTPSCQRFAVLIYLLFIATTSLLSMGGGAFPKIPDYRSYKVEDAPELVKLQQKLAKHGLKDPWIRYVG